MGHCVNEPNREFQANERQSACERIRSMSDFDARRTIQGPNKFVETHFVGALQIEGSSAFRRHCYPSNGADDIAAQVDRSDSLVTVAKNSDGVIASGEQLGSRGRSLAA